MSPLDLIARRLRARSRLLLAATLTAAALLGPTLDVSTSNALFVDSQAVASNTTSTATLANPGPVTVTDGADLKLTWTATPSTFAAGYRIYRSGTAGVVGPLVATVTPRTTVTWTDTTPLVGTNYYVVRAYDGTYWESGYTESSGVTVLTVSDQFNGAVGALGNTEVGARPWVAINGTWTRNGSGFATTATGAGSNPMAVVDVFSGDVDVRVDTPSPSGVAVYFRVQDGNDWLRARSQVNPYTYQYYNTEYQWTSYTTEYLYNDMRSVPQWQEAVTQVYMVSQDYTYSGWSGWGATGNTTACRTVYPDYGTFSDYDGYGMEVGQRTWSGYFTCAGGGIKYEQLYRSRSRQPGRRVEGWASSCSPSDSAYNTTSCGATQTVASGGTYYAYSSNGGADYQTGGSQMQNFGQYWATGPRDGDDTYANQSRQVATGTYWSSSACSGCPTRQVGPYTGTGTNYTVIAEKSVAGALTSLGSWNFADSPPTNIRVVANGSTISVYRNTSSLLGTITDGAFAGQTRHGIGLGGPTTSATTTVTNAYIGGL